MGEKVRRDPVLHDAGDFADLNKQPPPQQVIKGYACKQCGRVFSTGKALGGHVSSAHVSLKKSGPSSGKRKSISENVNRTDFETGKHSCKLCGKSFISERAVHGHMRLHSAKDRRRVVPPSKNPTEIPLAPKVIVDDEDFINNLNEKTVKGRRGRAGTKPHRVDSAEICLMKKKALLTCDPLELRKILDNHDDSGYFRRAFGGFLGITSAQVEEERDLEMEDDRISEDSDTDSSYFYSDCPGRNMPHI